MYGIQPFVMIASVPGITEIMLKGNDFTCKRQGLFMGLALCIGLKAFM
jgi:hypothetical protein